MLVRRPFSEGRRFHKLNQLHALITKMGLSDDVVRANGGALPSRRSSMGHGPETDWTWKPAMQQRYRRSQPGVVVGAVVFAFGCAVAGFIAGRFYPSSHVGPDVAGSPGPPSAAPPAGGRLSGDRGESPPSRPAAPAVVILNPGTADVGQQEAAATQIPGNKGRITDARDKQPSPESKGDNKARVFPERDYRALRQYMLSR